MPHSENLNDDVVAPGAMQSVLGNPAVLDALRDVVSSARHVLEAVDFVDMMLLVSGEIHPAVVSDDEIVDIDDIQLESKDGPAIQALSSGRICRIASSNSTGQWPDFRAACRRRGIMSMVTFPILVDGVVHGALSLYSRDYHAFGPDETRVGRSLAANASEAISAALRHAGVVGSTTKDE